MQAVLKVSIKIRTPEGPVPPDWCFSNLDELGKTKSGRENNSVFSHPHKARSTNQFVTVSLHRRELIRAGTTLVLVELFDTKFVARGKVNVAAPKVSAPPKSSIAR